MSRRPTHLAALVSGSGWHVRDLRRAADRLGIRLDAVDFATVEGRVGEGPARVSAGGLDLGSVDGVLVRMMPPAGLEPVVFRMDALHRVEAAGVPVLNPPRGVEASVDKYLALARIEAAGLAVPRTWAGESPADAVEAFGRLGGDVVVKPLFGSEGRGLVRLTDRETFGRVARAIARVGSVLYVQEFVPNAGHDLRVLALDGRIVGAIRRHAAVGDWRSNVAVGGRAEAIRIDPEAGRLAIRAAEAVGARLAGVDLLPDDRGRLVVLEVNAVPGWRALSAATGVDVAAEILGAFR